MRASARPSIPRLKPGQEHERPPRGVWQAGFLGGPPCLPSLGVSWDRGIAVPAIFCASPLSLDRNGLGLTPVNALPGVGQTRPLNWRKPQR